MARDYVVEVSMPASVDQGAAVEQLAEAFHVDNNKVASLLRRLPSVVTKPVSEAEAQVVARRFEEAGLRAVVLPSGGAKDEPAKVTETPEMSPSELRAQVSAGRSGATTGESAAAGSTAEAPVAVATPVDTPPVDTEPSPSTSAETITDTPSSVLPPDDAAAKRARAKMLGKSRRKAKAAPQGDVKRPSGSIRSKLMAVAIIPTVLTILGALTVIWLTARPALYEQLLESARNPAIATAASLSAVLEDSSAGDNSDYLELLQTILVARQSFARQNIAFIVATDAQGNPLSGYVAGGQALAAEQGVLEAAVQEQAQLAVARRGSGGGETVSGQIPGAGGTRIEVVAQPLLKNGQPFGAVVVGVSDAAVTRQVNTMLLYIFLFSLIPIALAILTAYWRARALTRNVLMLTERADQISRGDLEESVDLKSNDELENLSEALERMRISMKEALDRLRRRRI